MSLGLWPILPSPLSLTVLYLPLLLAQPFLPCRGGLENRVPLPSRGMLLLRPLCHVKPHFLGSRVGMWASLGAVALLTSRQFPLQTQKLPTRTLLFPSFPSPASLVHQTLAESPGKGMAP